ncbi:hypothetical protein F5X97DRAFT_315138 [Nemania serpens]|nr:hypothetical protein F5X97DRAFT_315138 [Nemania serpens]
MHCVKDARDIFLLAHNSSPSDQDDLAAYLDELVEVSTRISNLINRVAIATNRRGSDQFDDGYNNGPSQRKEIEGLRQALDNSKNNLTDALRITLASVPKLSLTNVKLSDNAYQQNSRIIRGPKDKDFSEVTLRDIEQSGRSTMINSSMSSQQLDNVIAEQNKRYRMTELAALLEIESLPPKMKEEIFVAILKLAVQE